MLLSCAEQMLGERPLEQKLSLVRESGFDGVDLQAATLTEPSTPRRLADSGLAVGAIYSQVGEPGLLSARAADRARAIEEIVERAEAAVEVGAANLIVVPIFGEPRLSGFEPACGLVGLETSVLLAGLGELAERVTSLPVTITLEALNPAETHFLTDPATAATLCRSVGSPRIATMVDTYHCHRQQQDIPEIIAAVGEQLTLMHLSDSNRGLPGTGAIDFAAVLAALRRHGYQGWMGLETPPVEPDPLRTAVRHLRALAEGEGSRFDTAAKGDTT